MAYEEFEAIPRGIETPNIYGPADRALTVDESCMIGSARKNDKAFLQDLIWTQQPQVPVGIDWSNPITRGLAFAATPPTGDVISRSRPVLSGSSTLATNAVGVSYKAPSVQIPGAWTYTVNIPSSFDVTVICVVRNITGQGIGPAAQTLNFNSSEPVVFSTSGSQTIFSATGNASTTITTLSAGSVYTLAGVKRVASQEQWVNGQKLTTDVTGNRAVGSVTTVSIGRPGGGNNVENCEYMAVMYFNRALSESEIRSISNNPWQIFKPIPSKLKHYIPQQSILPSKVGIPGLIEQSKRPWTSQPQQATGIMRDVFPGRPIVYASRVSDGCFDQIGNRPPIAVSASSPTKSVSSVGLAGEFVSENSQYYNITTTTNLVSGYPLTVACWVRIDSVNGGVIYSFNGTGYSAILGCLDSTFLVNQLSAAGTNVSDATSADLGLHHIVCVHRSNTYSLYIDGVLRSQTSVGNYWWQPAAGNHSIGSRLNGSSPQYFGGAIQDLYIFQGELTEAEAKSLYRNHWQVFQPLSYKQFVGQNTLPNIQVYREKLAWTSQPQGTVGIDWSNPITRELGFAFNPGSGQHTDVLSGVRYSEEAPSGALNTGVAASGRYVSGSVDGRGVRWDASKLKASANFTVVEVVLDNGNRDYNRNPFDSDNQSGARVFQCRLTDTNVVQLITFDTSNNPYFATGTTAVSSTTPIVIVGRINNNALSVFLNGTLEGTGSASGSPNTFSLANSKLSVGCYTTFSTPTGYNGKIFLCLYFARALSDAEIKSLSDNPWQIFKPIPRRIENRTPVKPQPLLPKYNTWMSQPQIPVTLNNTGVISACLPILSNTGYSARNNRPLSHHYHANAHSLSIMNGLTIFSGSSSYDDVFDYNTSTDTRGNYALFSVFSVASLADIVVVAGNSSGDYLYIKVSASGAISFVGDSYVIVSSADGVVGIGMHTVVATLVSINGTPNRVLNVYLDGKLVAYSASIYIYTNLYLVGPRIYSSGLHSASTVGVHCCGILRDLNLATELHKNPWQIFKPIKYPARLK